MTAVANTIDHLGRDELARLGREYMLTGHVNDRCGLAAVRLGDDGDKFAQVAIDEWRGASPVYTRRLQQAFGFAGGTDVATIFKGLQLDTGFAHQFMDVRYEVQGPDRGRFWLNSCGALLDVEPMGDEYVHTMCHTIEDPTFDATAVATNPRARMRPVHRPPRPSAGGGPHCEWIVTIEPDVEPVVEDPLTKEVARSLLAGLPVIRPARGTAGMDDYAGPVAEELHLEMFSQEALAVFCREVMIEVHLLVRSLTLATQRTEIIEAEMIGSCWIMSERLTRLLGLRGDGIDDILAVLALHPAFQPADYQPIALERLDDTRARLTLLDGPARREGDLASWVALLEDGRDEGLSALVHGVDPRARCTRITGPDPTWEITVDPAASPATEPDWVALGKLSGSALYQFVTP